MSSEPDSTVLQADALSKQYRLFTSPPLTLRESLSAVARMRRPARPWREFWALRDFSLSVRRGERVALMGSNGAGKSTFLKILCRITPPTSGVLRVSGRVASMLEVGTGFHPELTGRENIFLNGAILGLSRQAISDRFELIVDFSEIGEFLDMPVKHYSSGMYVRLAFAIAAHVDPDILVIDEVLAVGDQQFRRKCLDHMLSTAMRNRTIVMVSHDQDIVRRVATRAVVLAHGKTAYDGGVNEAIAHHERTSTPTQA